LNPLSPLESGLIPEECNEKVSLTAEESIEKSKEIGGHLRESALATSNALERAAHAKMHSAVEVAYVTVSGRTITRKTPAQPTNYSNRERVIKRMIAKKNPATLDYPQPGETYRHYKGGIYRIVGVAIDEETHKPLVSYAPLIESKDLTEMGGQFWSRSLDVFLEKLPDGRPRFEAISSSSDANYSKTLEIQSDLGISPTSLT
jgi:hypothetical protein